MSVVEGVGLKPPRRVSITVSSADVTYLVEEANRRASFRGYSEQAGRWKKGLMGAMRGGYITLSKIEAAKGAYPIVAGLGGEHAVREYLSGSLKRQYRIDVSLREGGDGGTDILASPIRIDVKTRTRADNRNLVRVATDTGRKLPPTCDALVFCEWSLKDTIDIVGWSDVVSMAGWRVEVAPAGHINIAAEDCHLLPMNRLVSMIRGVE